MKYAILLVIVALVLIACERPSPGAVTVTGGVFHTRAADAPLILKLRDEVSPDMPGGLSGRAPLIVRRADPDLIRTYFPYYRRAVRDIVIGRIDSIALVGRDRFLVTYVAGGSVLVWYPRLNLITFPKIGTCVVFLLARSRDGAPLFRDWTETVSERYCGESPDLAQPD